jgi:hypothetical protein
MKSGRNSRQFAVEALESRQLLSGIAPADALHTAVIDGAGGGSSGSLTATAVKSTLGTSVISGSASRGSVSVKITNTASTAENSRATVAIFASTDGQVDGNSIQIGSLSQTLRLRAKQPATVSVRIKTIPLALANTYQLLAKVTDSLGNIAISSTGPILMATAAFVELDPERSQTVISHHGAATATVTFGVTNEGNSASKGLSTINFLSSPDSSLAAASLVYSAKLKLAILPHKTHLARVTIPAAQTATLLSAADTLLQVVDAAGDVETILLAF